MTIRELTKSRLVWRGRARRARRLHAKWKRRAEALEVLVSKKPEDEAVETQHAHAQAKRVFWWRAIKAADKMVEQRTRQLRTAPQEISQKGLEMLVRSEGFVPYVYADSRGFATCYVGHLIAQRAPNASDFKKWGSKKHPAPRSRVLEVLDADLDKFEAAVRHDAKGRPKQSRFDAFVHFSFNIGTGGFASSTVLKEHNAGHPRAAADAFMLWNKPPEILGRRRKEQDLYLRGVYS